MDFEEFEKRYKEQIAAAVAAMDARWGVKGYHAHNTSDGVAFVFALTDGGTEVAFVEDAGVGGGPSVGWPTRESEARTAFEAEAKRLFPDSGTPDEEMVEAILQKAGK